MTNHVRQAYETEKEFWKLLAEPDIRDGLLLYKGESVLREANKLVVENEVPAEVLRCHLEEGWAKRLVIAPTATISPVVLAEGCGSTLMCPDGDACLYMIADAKQSGGKPEPPYSVREVHPNDKERQSVHKVRQAKDSAIHDPIVRQALLDWTKARSEKIDGFYTWIVFYEKQPVGSVSAFRFHDQLTRIRDLFVMPEHRRKGLSQHLVHAVMEMLDPPYAIITDTHNTARGAYRKLGFRSAFLQSAFRVGDACKSRS